MTRSPDFNVGDLAVMCNAAHHPQLNGALAEIVGPEAWRGSVTPSGRPRPAQRLYQVRVFGLSGPEQGFAAAGYQLQPLAGAALDPTVLRRIEARAQDRSTGGGASARHTPPAPRAGTGTDLRMGPGRDAVAGRLGPFFAIAAFGLPETP